MKADANTTKEVEAVIAALTAAYRINRVRPYSFTLVD